MRRLALVLVLAFGAAACNSDGDPTVAGGGATSTTATLPGSGSGAPVTDPATGAPVTDPATGAPVTAAAGTGPASGGSDNGGDEATGDTTPTTGPSVTNPTPAAGTYTFRTTGTTRMGLQSTNVDETTTTVVEALAADTVRETSTSSEGTEVTELRYEPGRVALLLLELQQQGATIRFLSAAGEQVTPVPPDPGQSWSWSLPDETGQLTLAFSGTTRPGETITVAGGRVDAAVVESTIRITGAYSGVPVDGTVTLRIWIDPARRMEVRVHSVSNFTAPSPDSSDTTSEFTGFTPA